MELSKKDIEIEKRNIYEMIEYYTKEFMLSEEEQNMYIEKDYQRYSNKDTYNDNLFLEIRKKADAFWASPYKRLFGHSIPDQKSIKELTKYIGEDKILEVGAGLGLVAYLLKLEGVKIKATSLWSFTYRNITTFLSVEEIEGKDAIKKYKDHNILLLIWPDISDDFTEMLEVFQGNKVIYIGQLNFDIESNYGSLTGTGNFFRMLFKLFKIVKKIKMIDFYPIFSSQCYCFERK